MTRTPSSVSSSSRWSLRHPWHSETDLAALSLCRAQLASVGIELIDAGHAQTPGAAKMHGMEMVAASAIDARLLHDLSGVALDARWHERLPPWVRRYMQHGERWHGIPMGVHRANVAWVNAGIAAQVGLRSPSDPHALLAWLREAQHITRAPLALGSQPWQVGVVFEAIVLAAAGPQMYRLAFEQLQPSAWREPAMIDALSCLMSLRTFVDDDHLSLGWAEQLARVRRGEAALQMMGDWARVAGGDGLLEWEAPGTEGFFVAIVDFFVPLREATPAVADRAAESLTQNDFQRRFASVKGCMPALREAWSAVDERRARLLGDGNAVVPSFTFDQCCSIAAKQSLIEIVADHFVRRLDTMACARALAACTFRL
jgi:glucose/mannose transport system substrate-binding protein